MLLSALVMVGLPGTTALFTADYPHGVSISAGRIFRGERVTPAFAIADRSGGSVVDRSSSSAFGNDGRQFVTRAWPGSFNSSRYIDIEFNRPLPAGLQVTNVSLTLRLASDSGGTMCAYLEVRRAASGDLVSGHGSAASPLACTSGTAYSLLTVPVNAVSGTDAANDLKIRVFGRDTAAGAMRLDQVTLVGDTPYSTFALYPVLTREEHAGGTETIPWSLAGQ